MLTWPINGESAFLPTTLTTAATTSAPINQSLMIFARTVGVWRQT